MAEAGETLSGESTRSASIGTLSSDPQHPNEKRGVVANACDAGMEGPRCGGGDAGSLLVIPSRQNAKLQVEGETLPQNIESGEGDH